MKPTFVRKLLAPCGALTGALFSAVVVCAAHAQAVPANASPSPGAVIDAGLNTQLQRLAREAAAAAGAAMGAAPGSARVEIELGQLDPRLTLAPCQHIEPYLPPGARLLGKSRVGLRCLQGATRWNVTLPVTVKLIARSLVTSTALAAGTVLRVHHLAEAEVDLAAGIEPVIQEVDGLLGRTLARTVSAGEPLRRTDLKLRQWFAAGDVVRVVAQGAGFAVSAEGLALGPGVEGQRARVQTESGRIVTGMPTADRRVEVSL